MAKMVADLFARAKAENRFVLLDMDAVWCHGCHVMEETTYHDPNVVALINKKYIPVRVDQDDNPELSNRYGDWRSPPPSPAPIGFAQRPSSKHPILQPPSIA